MKRRIYELIEGGTPTDKDPKIYNIGKWFDLFISTLILLNVLAIVLESVHVLSERYGYYFNLFEYCSVSIFIVEYLLRCYVASYSKSEYKSTTHFMFSFYGVIDILSILPTVILGFGIDNGGSVLKQLRIFRLIRIIKLTRYNKSMNLILYVINKKRKELISTLFIALMLMIVVSSIMWSVESSHTRMIAGIESPSAFTDIPTTLYWSVVTLTTVGYGDITPQTPFGQLLFSLFAILGIALVAIPSGLIASGFLDEINKNNKND